MSSATDFPRQAVQPPVSPRAKPWQAGPAGEVRRACGAAHLRQCLMSRWGQIMNIGVLQLTDNVAVLVIIPALPLPLLLLLLLLLLLPLVAIPMACCLIALFCRIFLPLYLPAGDFPPGTGAVVNGAGKPSPPCRASIALSQHHACGIRERMRRSHQPGGNAGGPLQGNAVSRPRVPSLRRVPAHFLPVISPF
ncbi:hypothetical protein ACI2JI_24755 [Enterobacter cancerogenus]|uniref:hypothetical protein n=1 Tax=Enterobacter cancerogenus TaxID=69218 RepID=UPI00384B25AE